MRVLILNQPFHPDVVATAQIAKDLADALVEQGHDVTAIASRSIYGEKGATLPRRETVDGVRIIRVGSNIFGKGTTLGRLADFAMYYLRALWLGLTLKRFGAVVVLTTPPFISTVALMLKRLRGARVVYWLMDVYPDVMVSHGMIRNEGLIHRALRRLHRRVLKRVDATVALGRCMKERLVDQQADPESIDVIPVWSPTRESDDARDPTPSSDNAYRKQWGIGDRTLVMYSGNFGLAHDVDTFLEAARALRNDDSIRFAFVGGGKRRPQVEAYVREHALENCVLAPYQPRERLAELLAAADVHLVTMVPKWSGLVVPSKFFGVAAAARPSLFVGPRSSEIARLIDEWDAGRRVEPGDVEALVAALRELAADSNQRAEMGRRAAESARAHMSRAICVERLIALIENRPSLNAQREPADQPLHAASP